MELNIFYSWKKVRCNVFGAQVQDEWQIICIAKTAAIYNHRNKHYCTVSAQSQMDAF